MKKMLARVLILITAIITTNGFPSPNPEEYDQTVFQTPIQQQFDQQSTNEDYFDFDNSKSTTNLEQTAGFTISCIGEDRTCTKKNDCPNGFIHITNNFLYSLSNKKQECNVHDEICCILVKGIQDISTNIKVTEQNLGSNTIGFDVKRPFTKTNTVVTQGTIEQNVQSSTNIFPIPTHVQLGCAAALLCVEERFCTLDGTISPEPVTLTSKQFLQRVPLSSCKNPDNGVVGKCCRDPNYVDPWPTGNLPINYTGGFDEQGFPTFLNIAKVRPPKPPTQPIKTVVTTGSPPYNFMQTEEKLEPALVSENSVVSSVLIAPVKTTPKHENLQENINLEELKLKCGVRNTRPEKGNSVTVFGEIPWQAMVLHSKEKKILCSGVLVSTRDVLTAANCVESLSPADISIKLGEWKLGYELKHEEPLPYEILNVSAIKMHPGYTRGYGDYDLAILHLENPATFDLHVNPLCLTETKQLTTDKSCITTGWGKSILQAHYAGAIMHVVDMNILSSENCKEQLTKGNLSSIVTNGIICGRTKEDINNVCEGDIGGPLACENENGLYELAGIYSQDTGCLPTNQVAIFAPLDDKWLKENMLSPTFEQNLLTLPEQVKSNVGYETSFSNDFRESTLFENNEYLPPN